MFNLMKTLVKSINTLPTFINLNGYLRENLMESEGTVKA